MKALILLTLLMAPFLLVAQPLTENDHPLKIGPNYRIHPGKVNQTEVFIVKSPLTDNILFSSCNTLNFIPFFISEGVYTSIDGGSTWTGSDTCKGEPIAFHGGDPGIAIDRNGTFIMTRMGRAPFVGLFSHYSTDNGVSWSAQKAISTDDLERATLISDADKNSPYYGRTYAAWVKFALPYPMMISYTDNGAQSWSAPRPLNNPPNRSAGGDLEMGLNGKVYVCWAGVTDLSPFREIYVGFAFSENGGEMWNVTENAFTVNGITGVLPGKDNIRVNGLPAIAVDTTNGQRKGWIYIVTGQKDLAPAGSDPDIILNRSEDGGKTWSSGIRVNQDAVNNGKTQYFPAIQIDKYGAVNVIFYDDRFTTNDSCGVMLARSVDGGNTWSEFRINDHNFKPTPIGGLGQGYQGDNLDLVCTDNGLQPVWMDNRTGIYQVWTVKINYSDIDEIGELPVSKDAAKVQISPNPASSALRITCPVDSPGDISIRIYDLTGVLVYETLNHDFMPGIFTVTIPVRMNGTSAPLSPGIYLCRITHNSYVETLKLVIQ